MGLGPMPNGEVVYMTHISGHQWAVYFESTSYYTARKKSTVYC